MKKRSPARPKRKSVSRRRPARGNVGHIPLDQHKKEEARLEKLRRTMRSAETTFSADALRTRRPRLGAAPKPAAPATPDKVDFRELADLPDVRKQPANDKRCAGFAVAAGMECWLALNNPDVELPTLSEQHVFLLGKEKRTIGRACKEVKLGVLEVECFDATPPCSSPMTRTWRGTIEEVVKNKPRDLCLLLQQKLPIIHEIRISRDFGDFQGSGVYDPDRTDGGAHAMVIVGFEKDDDEHGAWIVMNSLGTTWGEGGFGRIKWNDPFCKPEVVVFVIKGVTRVA